MGKRIMSIVIAGSLVLQGGLCLSPVLAAEADPEVKEMSSAEDDAEPVDTETETGEAESDSAEAEETTGGGIEAEETVPEDTADEEPVPEDSALIETEEIEEEEAADAEAAEEAEEDLIEAEDFGIMLLATGPTDIVYDSSTGQWVYVVNGVPDYSYTGVARNSNGWFYVRDGVVDFTYTGFAENENGKWYIESGRVTFGKNSVIEDKTGAIGEKGTWWYVVGSEVQTDFTGLANYSNENGWWYIEDGKVSFTKDTIAKNKNGWFYVKESKVDFSFTGLADFPNENGWWYCENGKVNFNKDTIAKNKNGWWYIKDSKVDFGFTGLADFSNANGWWYCENGKVTFSHDGVEKNKNGWFYVKDSKVDFSYNGFASNSNGKWYIDNGRVTFNKNSVLRDATGAIGTAGDWWYVVGSKVQTGFTGLADYSNENGWWYIENGKVTFSHDGVEKNKNGWFYVKDSKVDFSFNGIAANSNGSWYIKNGKVDFSYTGTVSYEGKTYNIEDGKVVLSTPVLNETSWDFEGVKVSWGKVDGADGYMVFRKKSGGSWSGIGTTTSTSFVDENSLSYGTTYYYTVRAYKGDLDTANAHAYSSSYWSSYDSDGVSGSAYQIMGTSSVTANQLIASYSGKTINKDLNCTLDELALIFVEEAKEEGVRVEVAWCQTILETGWLQFENCDVSPTQNNYAGIGATGNGVPGNSFDTPREGVRAQIQHLKAYASTQSLNNTCVDPRFNYVTRGTAKFVEILGIQENPGGYGWAGGADYGPHIVRLIKQTGLEGD